MLRTMLFAAAAAFVLPSQAETWHFQYRGFQDVVADVFLPDRTLTGSFVGEDANGDGTVALDEISSFMLNSFDFVDCQNLGNPYFNCGMEAFSYGGGALSFTAGISSIDPEGAIGGGHFFFGGIREYRYEFRPGHDREWEYHWTPETTLTISPAPEPGTWALLLVGIPVTAFVARRRQR